MRWPQQVGVSHGPSLLDVHPGVLICTPQLLPSFYLSCFLDSLAFMRYDTMVLPAFSSIFVPVHSMFGHGTLRYMCILNPIGAFFHSNVRYWLHFYYT